MSDDPVPELEIVDLTEVDRVKITENRKKLEVKQDIESKLRRTHFRKDENLPELKEGDKVKLVYLKLGAVEAGGRSQTFWEPTEIEFLVNKRFFTDDKTGKNKLWYNGVAFGEREGRWKGEAIKVTKWMVMIPHALILSIGKGLGERTAKDVEVVDLGSVEPDEKTIEL